MPVTLPRSLATDTENGLTPVLLVLVATALPCLSGDQLSTLTYGKTAELVDSSAALRKELVDGMRRSALT